jgi:hypothetical protein
VCDLFIQMAENGVKLVVGAIYGIRPGQWGLATRPGAYDQGYRAGPEDKVLSARPHGTPCDLGPEERGASMHIFSQCGFSTLLLGFFMILC